MEKVEIIKPSGIITIKLSGSFYHDIQNALMYLTSGKEPDEVTAFIQKINNEETDASFDEWEKSVQTLMILCAEIEAKAREQKVTEMVELPTEEDDQS